MVKMPFTNRPPHSAQPYYTCARCLLQGLESPPPLHSSLPVLCGRLVSWMPELPRLALKLLELGLDLRHSTVAVLGEQILLRATPDRVSLVVVWHIGLNGHRDRVRIDAVAHNIGPREHRQNGSFCGIVFLGPSVSVLAVGDHEFGRLVARSRHIVGKGIE